MSHELPEFSADLAHCDPCGWPEADTEYVPASTHPGDLSRALNPFGGRWPVFAFLKRTCTRCGFQWAEAPLPPRQEEEAGDVNCRCDGTGQIRDHLNRLTDCPYCEPPKRR